jgi:hypothetical protein
LGISTAVYPSAYRLLRTVSDGIGITYIDRAGRYHKFYVWGDIPLLGTRMLASGKLTERQRAVPHLAPMEPPIKLHWDIPLIGPDEDT